VLRIYTEDQLTEDWNAITPVDRIKAVSSWVPKEMKIESDTTISLIINGVRQVQAIDNHVAKALEEHQDDANDENT